MRRVRERRGGVRRQAGLATVEFAIGALVVLVLMLVSAEAGRAYYSYSALDGAVRSGARYLSTVALDAASVMDLNDETLAKTRRLVAGGDPDGEGRPVLDGLVPADVRVSQTGSSGSAGRYVQVSATFDYRPMIGVIAVFGREHDLAFTMRAASTMRVLR